MTCHEMRPFLAETATSASHTLPPEASAHLEVCASCRSERNLLSRAALLILGADPESPQVDLRPGIRARRRRGLATRVAALAASGLLATAGFRALLRPAPAGDWTLTEHRAAETRPGVVRLEICPWETGMEAKGGAFGRVKGASFQEDLSTLYGSALPFQATIPPGLPGGWTFLRASQVPGSGALHLIYQNEGGALLSVFQFPDGKGQTDVAVQGTEDPRIREVFLRRLRGKR